MWGLLLAIPGDWWADLLAEVGSCAFRVTYVVRFLRGYGPLKEFEVSLFVNQSSAFVSFYYQDEA